MSSTNQPQLKQTIVQDHSTAKLFKNPVQQFLPLTSDESLLARIINNPVDPRIDNSYYDNPKLRFYRPANGKVLAKKGVIDLSDFEIKLRNALLSRDSRKEYIRLLDEILHPEMYKVNGVPCREEEYNDLELKEVRKTLCKVSRAYIMVVMTQGEDNHAYLKVLTNDWLFERCLSVERKPDGHLDLWARAHYKSTIITTVGSIQELLINPKLTILVLTYTSKQAGEMRDYIKSVLETNLDLIYLFDDILYKNPHKEAPSGKWTHQGLWMKSNNSRFASIAISSIEGGGKIGHHAGLLIFDDTVVPASVATQERRDKLIGFLNTAVNLGSPGQDINRKQYVGTRYHKQDAYQYLMDSGQVIPRVHPATDNGRIDGKPVFLSQESWEKDYLTQDSYSIACNMLLDPTQSNISDFDIKFFKFYTFIPSNLDIFIIVDPASGKTNRSDYTSMVVLGVQQQSRAATDLPKIYLLDGVKERLDLNQKWERLKGLYLKWENFSHIHGNGRNMINVFYEIFGASVEAEALTGLMSRDEKIVSFEINKIRPKGEKHERIKRLIPHFKSGCFLLPAYSFENNKVQQLRIENDGASFIDRVPCFNKLTPDGDKLFEGLAKFMVGGSNNWTIQRNYAFPLVKKSYLGHYYDYTEAFIQEFQQFPFCEHEDVLDSVAMYYDIENLIELTTPMRVL